MYLNIGPGSALNVGGFNTYPNSLCWSATTHWTSPLMYSYILDFDDGFFQEKYRNNYYNVRAFKI